MEINDINNVLTINTEPVMPASKTKNTDIPQQQVANGQRNQQENTQNKNEKKLNEAVDRLNKTAVIFDRSLKFKIHEKTNTMVVSVIDTTNNKVIRQIPSEEVLDMVAKMEDYLGLIFDKKA